MPVEDSPLPTGVPAPLRNAADRASLRQAGELQAQIDALVSQQDALLGPVANRMLGEISSAADGDRRRLESMVAQFPAGFFCSELLTAIYRRYGR